MIFTWFTEFILLFQPEDSSLLPDEKSSSVKVSKFINKKFPVSIKALIWTAFSILAGLAIGQLH